MEPLKIKPLKIKPLKIKPVKIFRGKKKLQDIGYPAA